MKGSTDIILSDKILADTYRVYLVHDIFKRDPVYADIPVEIDLWELLGEPKNPDILYIEIDGVAIPSYLFSTTKISAGQLVDIKKIPQGDGDEFKRAILNIIVLVIAYYYPPALGWGKFATAVFQVAIITAGQLLINALVPFDQPEQDNRQPAPLNNLGVTRNRLAPFAIVPRMFGKVRQYPPYAANPYTEVTGSNIWLNAIFCIGEGYDYEISDIRIGTTSIDELEGVSILKTKTPQYPDIYQEFLDIGLDQDALDPNGDDATRATQANTTRASVDVSFPRGLAWMKRDGDKRSLEIDFDIEYRENGTSDPWVHVADEDWRVETSGDTRGLYGNPDSPFNSFTDPQGASPSHNWGTGSGSRYIQPVFGEVAGTGLDPDHFNIMGASLDGFRISIKWTFPSSKTWDVRVKRRKLYRTEDGTPFYSNNILFDEGRISETFIWSALRSYNDNTASAVDDSGDLWYMQIRIRANDQLNGSLETFNYISEAYVRAYNGSSWDAPAKTRNPAWAFCEMLTGNSIAESIADSDFIIDDIKDWADWCDTESFTFDYEFTNEQSLFNALRQVCSAGRASLSQREGKFTVITDNEQTDPVQMFTKRNCRNFKGTRIFLSELHGIKVRYRSESEDYQWTEREVYNTGYTEETATQFEVLELLGVVQDDQAYAMAKRFMAESVLRQEFYSFTTDLEHLICQRGDTVLVQNESMLIGSGTARVTDITGSDITLDGSFLVEVSKSYLMKFRSHKVASPSYDISSAVVTAPSSGTDVSVFTVDSVPTELDVGDLAIFGESGSEVIRCKVLELVPKNDLSGDISVVPEAAAIYDDIGEIPAYTPIISSIPDAANVIPPAPEILTIESYGIGTTQPSGEQSTRVVITYSIEEIPRGYGGPLFIQIAYREWDGTADVPLGNLKYTPWTPHDQSSIILTDLQNNELYEFSIRARTSNGMTSLYSFPPLEHTVTSERTITTEPVDAFTVTGLPLAVLVELDVTAVIQQDISFVETWYSTVNNRDGDGSPDPIPTIVRSPLPANLTDFTTYPFTISISTANTYYFWSRLVNIYGQASTWYPTSPTAGLSAVVSASSDGLSVHVGNVFQRAASPPSTPSVDDGQYNFTTQVLTPPSGWFVTPPAGSNPLYVSTGSFSIIGPTGIDPTVTWTAPSVLVQDGADGSDGSDGSDGDDGLSVHVGNVFQRAASPPSTPSADDGQYNFTTQTLTPPTGWFVEPPAGTDPLYISTGSFSIIGQTGTDTTVTWTSPDVLVQDGADGADGGDGDDGLSVHVANVYKRAASPPSTPSADDGQYNFTTNVLTPPSTWFVEPPAGSNPLYVCTGSFSIVGQTGTDTTVTWTAPDLLVQDGADGGDGDDGDDGLSVHVANVYKRASSPPSTPSVDDGQYNFTTQTLTPPSTWLVEPPAGSDPLYISTGSFSIIGQTGTDTTVTWTSPDLLVQDGATGPDGDDGLSVHVANVYKRAASPPSTPSADDGQYNFTTQVLTPPSTWFVEPPAGSNPLYVSTGSFSIVGQTGIDTTVTWTSPDLLVQDGATGPDGDDGLSVYLGNVFQRAASPPSTPTPDDGQYNFTTQTLTPPSGWFVEPPAGSLPLYVSTGSFSIIGQTGTDTTVTWTAPDLLVQDGATGGDGDDGLSLHVANIFKRSPIVPSTPSVDDGSYNFTTNTLTPPSGWFENPPTGDDPLYTCVGSFSIIGQTGTDTTVTWTAPDLLLTDAPISGNALNLGRQMATLSRWFADPVTGGAPHADWTVETPGSPPVWDTVFECDATGMRDVWSEQIPIDNQKKYRVSVWAKQLSGTAKNYLAVAMLDSSRANIVGSTSDAVNWTGKGTYHYWEISGIVFAGSWTKYTFDFGGDSLATFPTDSGGTFYICIGSLSPWEAAVAGAVQLSDLHVTELSDDGVSSIINYAGPYASFEKDPPTRPSPGVVTVSFSTSEKWVGNKSFQNTSNAASGYTYFASDTFDYNLSIPAGQKWIISSWCKLINTGSPLTTANVKLWVRRSSDDTFFGTDARDLPNDGNWHRIITWADLTGDSSTTLLAGMNNNAFNSAGDVIIHCDGFQIEVDDGSGIPKDFAAPPTAGIDAAINYAGPYASFETSPVKSIDSSKVTTSYDTGQSWSGNQSLKVVAHAVDGYTYMGNNTTDYNLNIPANQNWIISGYVRLTNANNPKATDNVSLYLKAGDSTHYAAIKSVAVDDTWHRIEGSLDLTANASTTAIIRVDNDSFNAAGDTTMHFDGLQLELDDGTGRAREYSPPPLGSSSIVAQVYKRAASPPSTPSADDGSYNFTTRTLTPPSGWSTTPPATDGNPLYVSTGIFEIIGATGIDNTVTWTATAELVSDGTDGSDGSDGGDGDSSIVAQVFKRASSAPSTPSVDDGQYNFTTNTLTPPSGWSITPPTTDGNPLYVSTGIFEINGTTGIDTTITWTVPAILVEDGEDGADAGFPILLTDMQVYKSQASQTWAGVRFNNDGTIDANGPAGTTYSQINSGEYYTGTPAAGVGDDFEVRCSDTGGYSWDEQAAAVGTWVALTSDRLWRVIRTAMDGPGFEQCVATFQIRRINSSDPVAGAEADCKATHT
ncbi:hypothetical protein KAR91_14250 [Candidatus Pacearchaeota archaeon]|nr:hypothetical protein [Candidatus Pacearchaeota archaeon]